MKKIIKTTLATLVLTSFATMPAFAQEVANTKNYTLDFSAITSQEKTTLVVDDESRNITLYKIPLGTKITLTAKTPDITQAIWGIDEYEGKLWSADGFNMSSNGEQDLSFSAIPAGQSVHYTFNEKSVFPYDIVTVYVGEEVHEYHFQITNEKPNTSVPDKQVPTITRPTKPNSIENFIAINTYNSPFADVPSSAWYASPVKQCYELGLMGGKSENNFDPNGQITIAEAIVMATRVNQIYTTNPDVTPNAKGPWYQGAIEYAQQHNIIQQGDFSDFTKPATRAELSYVFSNALPEQELLPVHQNATIPDVNANTPFSSNILNLYKAGILAGADAEGNFNPSHTITRAEAATIINRIALPTDRI